MNWTSIAGLLIFSCPCQTLEGILFENSNQVFFSAPAKKIRIAGFAKLRNFKKTYLITNKKTNKRIRYLVEQLWITDNSFQVSYFTLYLHLLG